MMRIVIIIVTLALLGGGSWWFVSKTAPSAENVQSYLQKFSNTVTIQNTHQDSGQLTLSGIDFDPDGFYAVERIDISAANITVNGLRLNPQIGDFDLAQIAGWLTQKPPTQTLTLQNARLALYHPEIGMLNFDIGAQLRFQDEDNFTLQANIDSQQKQLGLSLTINGEGVWREGETPRGNFTADIAQTNINLMNLQLNRMTGSAQIDVGDEITITPDIYAGAVTLFGLPWQNVHIKSGSNGQPVLTARSFPRPDKDTPLSLLALLSDTPVIGMRAANLRDFLGYLERYGARLSEHQKALTYESLDNVHIRLTASDGNIAEKLIQRAPLASIEAIIGREGLQSQIKETILLPH